MAINLTSEELQQNPYDLYAQLRTHEPITNGEASLFSSGKGVFVTRYADVMTVLKDPRFSVERRKVDGKDILKAW